MLIKNETVQLPHVAWLGCLLLHDLLCILHLVAPDEIEYGVTLSANALHLLLVPFLTPHLLHDLNVVLLGLLDHHRL